jgi:hypothetical protein
MNIDNVGNEARKYFNEKTKGMNQLAIIVICATAAFVLLAFFVWRTFFTNMSHTVELFQGVLVCSTALMGLSGLMIIEIKKTNVSGLYSQDMFEKVNAINTISSLGGAFASLRWVLSLSIVCIILSIVQLITNNSFLIVAALAAFLDQIYLFVWGLVFLDLLPS